MNQPRDFKAIPGVEASDLVSHQLVKYLEARGVEHVFGLCGHTNIAVLAELAKSSIRFINTRHEQVAAHMADGYARA
ncbi:MAG TPA: thiamine pyrophosphate-binding protein, partial [Burkholderiales bacterium]|nr:thiamine pyrophosphate-binding protein [Burkholderiales bacterium]